MKAKKTFGRKAAAKITAWWVGKGCVQPSQKLEDYAEQVITMAVKRAVRAERAKFCRLMVSVADGTVFSTDHPPAKVKVRKGAGR